MQHKIIINYKINQFKEKEILPFARKIETKLPPQYWDVGVLVNLNEVFFQLSEIRFDLDNQMRIAVFTQVTNRKLAVS